MLGIPTHLAPRVNAWSLVRAFHAAGFGCMVMAAVIVIVERSTAPSEPVWAALLGLFPMAGAGAVHARRGTWRSAAAFLVVGAASAWWFTLIVLLQLHAPAYLVSYLVSLVVIPLILVGGSGPTPARVIAWSLVGFVVGRIATSIATLTATGEIRAGVLSDIAVVVVVVIVGIGARVSARLERIQPELLRSAREEHVAAARRSIEAEAAAILHDTVLSHLSAITVAPAGPMDADLGRTVADDLAMFEEQEWLVPRTATVIENEAGATLEGLDRIVYEFGTEGLTVDVSGSADALGRLPQEVGVAVYRAINQCLANVRKHAGTDRAELSVFTQETTCSVMVVDDGRGFDESTIPDDRMGIRNSIRERIARIGGTVHIWSAPGNGTSVILTVPFVGTEAAPGMRRPARGSGADAAPALPGDTASSSTGPTSGSSSRPSAGPRLGPA